MSFVSLSSSPNVAFCMSLAASAVDSRAFGIRESLKSSGFAGIVLIRFREMFRGAAIREKEIEISYSGRTAVPRLHYLAAIRHGCLS